VAKSNKQDAKEINLQLTAIDTWFFRESRPHDAAGASELSSLFPPSIRTLAGAVRRFIGDSINIDWQAFSKGETPDHDIDGLDFETEVGGSDGLGLLSLRGVWVSKGGKRLYPVPFYLMHKEYTLIRLQIGDRVMCDLGNVRLPELPKSQEGGYKNFEQSWVSSDGLHELLNGKVPDSKDIVKLDELLTVESRLGIARNNATRSVIEGQLYQTRHIRIKDDVAIELDILSLDERLAKCFEPDQNEIVRLGGEGRMAALTVKPNRTAMPFIKTNTKPINKIIIHFVSAADFDGQMFPKEFKEIKENDKTVHWQGTLNGIELRIEAAVIGKVHREGGWDMKEHKPRAVKSYIPAGSAWFCSVVDNSLSGAELVQALHEKCIGEEQQWGRGQILIGQWVDKQGDTNDSK
jgi:CRISPR-associated protein Cmr3